MKKSNRPVAKLEEGMEKGEKEKETRARPTRGMREGYGKAKSSGYEHTLGRADGRGPTRFGRRFRVGGMGGSTGKVQEQQQQRFTDSREA